MTKLSQSPSIDWPTTIFSLGIIVLLWGVFNYFFPSDSEDKSIETSNTQRNLAIEEALRNGDKTYKFETNFIPGIGTIGNPDAYKKELADKYNQTK